MTIKHLGHLLGHYCIHRTLNVTPYTLDHQVANPVKQDVVLLRHESIGIRPYFAGSMELVGYGYGRVFQIRIEGVHSIRQSLILSPTF